MKTNINDIIEFSKIYKRVMDIELRLKDRLKFVLTATYPGKMFYKLKPFILEKFKGRYKKFTKGQERDQLLDLVNSNKSEEEKLDRFIDMAYLSDVLLILTDYKRIYQDVKFSNNFYRQKIVFNDLKKYAAAIKNYVILLCISEYRIIKLIN